MRIVVLSGVRLYREGLASSLAQRAEIEVLGNFAPSGEMIELLPGSGAAAVILDVGTEGALRFAEELDRVAPALKIVAFAVDDTDSNLIAYAEAGIVGYIGRDGSVDDLVRALQSAVRDEVNCSPRHAALLVKRLATLRNCHPEDRHPASPVSLLTSRERDIALLLRDGLSNKEIARSLRIGSATVKNHVHSILSKLQVTSRGQAAAALHRGNLPAKAAERLR